MDIIRSFEENDLPEIMKLWLNTNLIAHDFIPSEYWVKNFETVKAMLPHAELYVCDVDAKLRAFVGVDGGYIAGIFVSPGAQSNGIGGRLLEVCKGLHDTLSLNVFEKNQRAVDFYLKNGFEIVSIQMDKGTGEPEITMQWRRWKKTRERCLIDV